MKITPYLKIRDSLQTGGQILCDGEGYKSWLIKLATSSDISHVAKIVRNEDGVFVWESTRSKRTDGVQMTLMSQWLKEYKGKVYVRKLVFDRDEKFYQAYRDTREAFRGKKYERHLLELLGAVMPWRNKEDFKHIFCSELTAAVDSRSDVLEYSIAANEIKPADYMPGRRMDNLIKFNDKPACFEQMVRLK